MASRPHVRLPQSLALGYALLVAYACLHPLAGWRDSGLPAFDWLWAPWPKYFILEDFVFNILGYLPLGLLAAAALPAAWGPRRKVAVATLFAGLLSLGLGPSSREVEAEPGLWRRVELELPEGLRIACPLPPLLAEHLDILAAGARSREAATGS